MTGPDGERVEAVAEFLRHLQGVGQSVATQRSYALALLRLGPIHVVGRHACDISGRDLSIAIIPQ